MVPVGRNSHRGRRPTVDIFAPPVGTVAFLSFLPLDTPERRASGAVALPIQRTPPTLFFFSSHLSFFFHTGGEG
jgi:hypothetical protein